MFSAAYFGMKPAAVLALMMLLACGHLSAQSMITVFPQVADGVAADGTYYRTTFMIMSWDYFLPDFTCTLRLHGLNVTFNRGVGPNSFFTISVPNGLEAFLGVTQADQPLRTGYAVLTCPQAVAAQALYSYYAADGTKFGEATVFGVNGDKDIGDDVDHYRLVADQRGGSQLGIAI